MKHICLLCSCEFIPNAGNQKLCSDACRVDFYRLKRKKTFLECREKSRKTATCKVCQNGFDYHYRTDRGPREFCGRSCASKYHIQQGTFDAWRLRSNEPAGEKKNCLNPGCKNVVYLEPRYKNTKKGKVCSFECEKAYFSQLYKGDKNPSYGRKMSDESKIKQMSTLQTHYPGILNAFSLAKKRTKTKPQIAIYDYVRNKYPYLNFEIEKRLNEGKKEFYGDIVSFDKKLLIEFNGDYWHCNPSKYDSNFFHQVKKLHASEIWRNDEKRLETLASFGYTILVIWESQLKDESWKEVLDQWIKRKEECEQENNINVVRSSVNK